MANISTFLQGFIGAQSSLTVTSDFGKRNIDGDIRPHNGIDIRVPVGTQLRAPIGGTVVERRVQQNGAGLYLTIEHRPTPDTSLFVLMMHLSEIEDTIHVGSEVAVGDVIGRTGGAVSDQPNAGHSTGPHLHLEVRRGGNSGGNAVDPKFQFMGRHTLTAAKTGAILLTGNPALLSFPEEGMKSQSGYTYSLATDITMMDATETPPPKKKRTLSTPTERLAAGVWQITKILIDSSVKGKQVLDSGISTQQGSLINFFRKVCQEPLVEFMGDTFGNQYYYIVRRPPFDKEGIERMMDLTLTTLNPEDILQTALEWNSDGGYSWYRMIPYADLLGVKESGMFMPAVFFPEYAAVWGSRPLCVESNYYSYEFSGRSDPEEGDNSENCNRIIRNCMRDFRFIIESNAYLPFTRRGTITLIGDRRIKRGTLIMHTSGEVFYVDAVSNSYEVTTSGVTRTTTLSVSRGMYPNYIYGKEVGGKKYSYFDLIDWGEGFDIDKLTGDTWHDAVSKWKVKVDVFGFFMSRQQVYWEHMNKYVKDFVPFEDINSLGYEFIIRG